MNGRQHFWLFLGTWLAFTIYATITLNLYIRVLCAILLIPFFNPDVDQQLDAESHRWFFTHSLLPTSLFWWCIQPALAAEYQYYILLILWFFPWSHLIGDCKLSMDKKAYGGSWLIRFLPHVRNTKKGLDMKYSTFGLVGSWLWLLGNIFLGIIGGIWIL